MARILTLILLALPLAGCMGSPESFSGPGGGGGFTGTPPGGTPFPTASNPSIMVSSGGAISSGPHMMTRISVGEAPQATVMSGPNTKMAISLQPSLMDMVGL